MKWPSPALRRDDKPFHGHFHLVTSYSSWVYHKHCDFASIPIKRKRYGSCLITGDRNKETEIKIIRSMSWFWIHNQKHQKLNFSRILSIIKQMMSCSKYNSKHPHVCAAPFAKQSQEPLSKPPKTVHSLLEAPCEYLSSSIWLQSTVMQWL